MILGERINPNEIVNISLTQIGGNNADLVGATVVITDTLTSDTILSATWDGSDISTDIVGGTYYTISLGDVTGYLSCEDKNYKAKPSESRNISFQYRHYGAYVEATDGILYTSSTWQSSGKTANSVVLLTENHSIRMALTEVSLSIHKNYTDPITDYISNPGDRAAAQNYYNGSEDTDKIIQFNTAYGSNTTYYAAPYCKAFTFQTGEHGYLPSIGEAYLIYMNKTGINNCLSACGGTSLSTTWYTSTCGTRSSSAPNEYCVWRINMAATSLWLDPGAEIYIYRTGIVFYVRPIAEYN